MVRLIHIKIPQAVSACLRMAAKIDISLRNVPPGAQHQTHRQVLVSHRGHYLTLARELEGLKYISAPAVDGLVRSNSFLREFVQ